MSDYLQHSLFTVLGYKVIKGFDNYIIDDTGAVLNIKTKKRKSFRYGKRGYLRTDLYQNGKRFTKRLHRLLAENFILNPYNYTVVNHKDGNKLNNTIDNLEWVTVQQNNIHALKLGLKTYPLKLSNTDKLYCLISVLDKSKSIKNLADFYNMSEDAMEKCIKAYAKKYGVKIHD